MIVEDKFSPHEPFDDVYQRPKNPKFEQQNFHTYGSSPSNKNFHQPIDNSRNNSIDNSKDRAPRNYRKFSAVAQKLARREKKAKNQADYPLDLLLDENSERAEKIASKILFGEKIDESDIKPDLLNLVIQNIEHKRSMLLLKGEYEASVKASQAIEVAKKYQLQAAKRRIQEIEMADVMIRKGHANTDEQIIDHISLARFNDLSEKLRKRLENLKTRHKRELEEHEARWQDDHMQRIYFKKSSKLMEMRLQERKLIAAKRFDEAMMCKRIADQMEAQEWNESKSHYDSDYRASKALLLAKQKEEEDILRNCTFIKKQVFHKRAEIEKTAIQNRKAALRMQEEIASDAEKLWRIRHRSNYDFGLPRVIRVKDNSYRSIEPESARLLPPLEEKGKNNKKINSQR